MTVGPLGLEDLLGAKALGPREVRLRSWCEMSSLPTKRQGIGDLVGGTWALEALRSCEEGREGRKELREDARAPFPRA